ncbi:PREDICTED: sugar transport protein 8-like [Ipomoea nil]|uniref:sugar transport protein 8-like n=1 Tax=Ipomoea nil TaxID=35883 RepID=UPI000900DF75|nr:PREDICTED: sugar transport protein 8-like [Ipomoea nil]
MSSLAYCVTILQLVVAIFGVDYFGRRALLIEGVIQMLNCSVGCGWLVASEIYLLEIRTAGFFFAVSTNMIFTFIVAVQALLTMLCTMKSAIFFMFASFALVMGLLVVFLLPETKGIPIDEMNERVWKKHWLWKRCFDEKEDANTNSVN